MISNIVFKDTKTLSSERPFWFHSEHQEQWPWSAYVPPILLDGCLLLSFLLTNFLNTTPNSYLDSLSALRMALHAEILP